MAVKLTSLLALFAFVATPAPAFNTHYLEGEITVRPAPPAAPARERLAYAQRLFDADKLRQADEVAEALARENGQEAAEALLLRGRIAYSQGYPGRAIGQFESLWLRFPESAPVRSGRLASTLALGAGWLIEEHAWRPVGKFLDLLRQLDPEAVGRLARELERRVDAELAELQPLLARHRRDTGEMLRRWLDKEQQQGFTHVGNCMARDSACRQKMDRAVEKELEESRLRFQKRWQQKAGPEFQRQREEFARLALEDAQRFPLLRELLTSGTVLSAVEPGGLTPTESPYHCEIRVIDYEEVPQGIRSLTFTKDRKARWQVWWKIQPEMMTQAGFPELRFGRVERTRLLERLGELLRTASEDGSVRRRKL